MLGTILYIYIYIYIFVVVYFLSQLIFIFPLFLDMVMYGDELKQRKNKN